MPKPRGSCDACRKSKLGCDATLGSGTSCFNCVRRGIKCSVAATKNEGPRPQSDDSNSAGDAVNLLCDPYTIPAKRTRPANPVETSVRRTSPSAPSATNDSLPRQTQAQVLHSLLWDIFQRTYEPRLSLFTGSSCCPYVGSLDLPRSITRLAVALDAQIRKARDTESTALTREIEQCHLYAIYAFASRWLPVAEISPGQEAVTKSSHLSLRSRLWDLARQHILVAISHPTYRSAQALHLFAASGATKPPHFDALVDGCHDICAQHHERLRVQTLEFCGSDFSFFSRHSRPNSRSDIDYTHVRDILYWSGALADVWRTTLYYRRPILLPGRLGESRVWVHVREHLAAFDRAFDTLRQTRDAISDALAMVVLQHASACKSMFWYSVSKVQDSLVHHIIDDPPDMTFGNSMKEKVAWERMFGSLVGLIERDYLMLNAQSQLSCFLVIMHFNTGVLLLLDLVDESSWHPSGYTSFDLEQVRLSSTRAIVNAINMALRDSRVRRQGLEQSIILMDPYPDTAAECLLRCGQSLIRLQREALLSASTCQTMLAIISEALGILSRMPGCATSNLEYLHRLCVLHDLKDLDDPSTLRKGDQAPGEPGHDAVDGLVSELASRVSTQDDLFESMLNMATS